MNKPNTVPTVYLAGPMRGYEDFNRRAFDDAEFSIKTRTGWNVINPATLDREAGGEWEDDHEFSPAEIRVFVRRDLEALLTLRPENGDKVAFLPGWLLSRGARAEYAVAEWLGLDLVSAVTLRPLPPVIHRYE